MYYTVYRITNKINLKIYIGKHQTNDIDDGYMGSGKHLKSAIKKHGIENFSREIIHIFETEEEMNAKERELVTEEFCGRKDTYNICEGGKGGFGYINRYGLTGAKIGGHVSGKANKELKRGIFSPSFSCSENTKLLYKIGKKIKPKNFNFNGKNHSDETKFKIGLSSSVTQKGKANSQYGSIWITDGVNNKKIKNIDTVPNGWYKGRKVKISNERKSQNVST